MTETTDTPAAEPELQWNGQQWLSWNGTEWVAVDPQPAPPPVEQDSAPASPIAEVPASMAPTAAPAPAPTYAPPPRTTVVTDKGSKGGQAVLAWVIAVITLGYMLPWAIAASRGKANSGAIGLINLLLGWTFIGWIVALVMACGAHQVAGVQQH